MVQKSWVNQPAMVKAAPVCDIIVDTFIHVCKQVRGTKADRKLLVHTRDCKGWTEREGGGGGSGREAKTDMEERTRPTYTEVLSSTRLSGLAHPTCPYAANPPCWPRLRVVAVRRCGRATVRQGDNVEMCFGSMDRVQGS